MNLNHGIYKLLEVTLQEEYPLYTELEQEHNSIKHQRQLFKSFLKVIEKNEDRDGASELLRLYMTTLQKDVDKYIEAVKECV